MCFRGKGEGSREENMVSGMMEDGRRAVPVCSRGREQRETWKVHVREQWVKPGGKILVREVRSEPQVATFIPSGNAFS